MTHQRMESMMTDAWPTIEAMQQLFDAKGADEIRAIYLCLVFAAVHLNHRMACSQDTLTLHYAAATRLVVEALEKPGLAVNVLTGLSLELPVLLRDIQTVRAAEQALRGEK